MKNTIAEIIRKYGTVKLHYLAIVFGTQANTEISYGNQNLNYETLITFIEGIRQPPGNPRLHVALQEAKKAFDEVPRRPGAKRVLVVLIDKKSVGDDNDVKKLQAAKELYGGDVIIIPVAIGAGADPDELEVITSRKDNLIEESKDVDPKELAKQIMEKTFGGKSLIIPYVNECDSVWRLVAFNVNGTASVTAIRLKNSKFGINFKGFCFDVVLVQVSNADGCL